MKKFLRNSLVAVLMVGVLPSFAASPVTPIHQLEQVISKAEVQELETRLNEIQSMDVSKMSRAEKRALRKEVKQIERTMDGNGGIYISVGALIIIIILLIILL